MKTIQTLCLLATLFFLNPINASAASRVEYILDVSGSMKAMSGGEKRIDAAKKAVAAMVQEIPDGSIVALRLYAHRLPPGDKVASCKDTELVVPFGPIDKAKILSVVNAATPLGQTPIAYSLEQAALDFSPSADEAQSIILVSDGEESCGGDPAATAKALVAKGFKFKIHTVGFDVDAKTKAQLEAIAKATGGQYMDARDAASLSSSLKKLTQDSLVIQKNQAVYGDEIRGGDSYESAVPLAPGKLFRLNHHQRMNQFDYFYVDAKPGQKVVVHLETGENGVKIRENQARENKNVYAGIQLHGPDRAKIKSEEIIGTANAKKEISKPVALGQEGRYYILVGSAYADVHKDNRFEVELMEMFDANSDRDAGDQETTALPITATTYERNFLSSSDTVDMYQFKANPGDYEIKARDTNEKTSLQIIVSDSDGVKLAQATSPNAGAAAKIEKVPFTKPGNYFLKIKVPYSIYDDAPYVFSIIPLGAASVTSAAGKEISPNQQNVIPSGSIQTSLGNSASGKELCSQFKKLPFLQKAKIVGLYSGIPLVGGWFIGMIWGYVKGKKSRKINKTSI